MKKSLNFFSNGKKIEPQKYKHLFKRPYFLTNLTELDAIIDYFSPNIDEIILNSDNYESFNDDIERLSKENKALSNENRLLSIANKKSLEEKASIEISNNELKNELNIQSKKNIENEKTYNMIKYVSLLFRENSTILNQLESKINEMHDENKSLELEIKQLIEANNALNKEKFCLDNIESLFSILHNHIDNSDVIQFFREQIKLTAQPKNNYRYSKETIIFSHYIRLASSTAYEILSDIFKLPTERCLRRYTSGINETFKSDDSNLEFLKSQCDALSEKERFITLKFDEVQLKRVLEYRSGEIMGSAKNKENEVANHALCFMISSLTSKYKEMVKLIPVSNADKYFTKKALFSVICNLEKICFKIICVTSDNAAVNRSIIKELTNNGKKFFI